MSDESVTQKLNTEGADLLTLAGVNDGNLVELSRLGRREGRAARRHDDASPVRREFVERAVGHRAAHDRSGAPAASSSRPTTCCAWATTSIAASGTDARQWRVRDDAGDTNGGVGGVDAQRIALPGHSRSHSGEDAGPGRVSPKMQENDIVVGIGPAGTGKTYLAVAAAVDALTRKRVRRIVLARPAVEAGESLGFLPGDMQAKVDPYLRPLYDALDEMMPFERIQRALESAYDRGRAARVHARPHARRRVRDRRRSAERDGRADEDAAHAPRRELEDGDHRRQDAGRSAEARGVGAHCRSSAFFRGSTASAFTTSTRATSSATGSCATSCARTPARRGAGVRMNDGEQRRAARRSAADPSHGAARLRVARRARRARAGARRFHVPALSRVARGRLSDLRGRARSRSDNVIAPFAFSVPKTEAELAKERDAAARDRRAGVRLRAGGARFDAVASSRRFRRP